MGHSRKRTFILSKKRRELLGTLLQEEGIGSAPMQRIPRRKDTGPIPLSFAQQRLWFLNELASGNAFYNIPFATRLSGPLNVPALKQSLNEIVRRHQVLRTTFAMANGHPIQVIAPALDVSLPVQALQTLPKAEREAQALQLALEEALHPFDLARGPLLRATLLQMDADEHILLLTMHHIISDGWSTGILIREMTTLYQAFGTGRPSPLPELPIQYADFAVWQRERLQGEILEEKLAYWRKQLGGHPPMLQLPTDRPRPPVQTSHGSHQPVALSPSLTAALKTLSQEEDATLFMTLLAAFKTLLYRYTRQSDIAVGTPIANRSQAEIEELIGFFVNTLVLSTDLTGNPTFRQLVRRTREVALGAYAHQDLPFEKLVEELQPERNLSHTPLFQVMFVLQNVPRSAQQLPGLTLTPLEVESKTTQFDLVLTMTDTRHGLAGGMRYNTDLFEAETISRMISHFQTLLEGIAADPEQRISDLPFLTDAERHQVLVDWNTTQTKHPTVSCAHELFEAQARQTPDAIAASFCSAEAVPTEPQLLTYRELDHRANQLAHHLQSLGVGPEVLVAVCLDRSLDVMVALLAILKAGAAFLPLDPSYPLSRLAFMLDDTQVPVLLSHTTLASQLPEHQAHLLCLDADWPTIARGRSDSPISGVRPDNIAYVIYTSGSTGQPKGVVVSHRGLGNLAQAQTDAFALQPDSRVLQFASLSFDASVAEIVVTLLAGATLCLAPTTDLLPAPPLIRLLRDQAITTATLPPSALAVLPPDETPALHTVVSAGEACPSSVVARWTPGRRFVNAYGPTETTVCASTALHPADNRPSSIGRPIANTQIYLLDPHLQPVPVGVPGELYVGSHLSLARGYLNRPGLTAERFIPDPFDEQPGARLYRTGDLARFLPNGDIEFLGRVDHQVKIRGFRIELGEIEATLAQHPDVRETVVLARDGDRETGDKNLVAYLLTNDDQEPIAGELRRFLAERLPEYMLPPAFVILETWPLLPNGKIDRRALPPPGQQDLGLAVTTVAPRDALELQLVQMWEEVLNIHPIGVTHNFFELGGHSLLAVRLLARIEQEIGYSLPLTTLFQGATVEHLAATLRQQQGVSVPSPTLVPLQVGDAAKPPLFFVHPAGGNVLCYATLVRHLGTHRSFYGLQARGMDGEQAPHTQIEAMASSYIKAIRSVQRDAPYLLAGWSLGGVVAFEIAQQLQSQGHEVALLALIDSRAPTDPQGPEPDDATLMANFALDLGVPWRQLSIEPEHFQECEPDERLAYVLKQAKQANVVPSGIQLSQIQTLFHVFKSNVQALRCYVPHVYPGSITLFKASETLGTKPLDRNLGWHVLAGAGVVTRTIAGNHYTIVREPNVTILAENIAQALNEVERKTSNRR